MGWDGDLDAMRRPRYPDWQRSAGPLQVHDRDVADDEESSR
jgi:hypothetical protein